MFNFRRLGPLGCFSLTTLFTFGQTLSPTASPQRSLPTAVRLERLPLAFERNVGQGTSGTDYLVRSGIMLAEFSATQMRLSLPPAARREQLVSVQLDGARKDARPIAADKLEGESNYLLGDDASVWHTHVPRYGRVTYPEVYNGIDLIYYGNGSQVEHDFVVHPGATPSSIRLRFDGVDKLEVTREGDLRVALDRSDMTLRRPRAYQTVDGVRHEVEAKFALADGVVSFHLGSYDRTQPLVIDPVLDYSTFLDDASLNVTGVAVDAAGNTYITGEASVTYAADAGTAGCSSCVSGTNKAAVYVTKLNATGTAVIYSTFIGGSVNPYGAASNDQSIAVAVDANNNAIVTGWTSSTDFPLKNPISSGVASFQDGFLTSLTPDGSALNFSSRLGGSSSGSSSASVSPLSLTTDAGGNVYVAGLSESPYLLPTAGALHNFSPSYSHSGAFLMKFSSSGALGYCAIVGEMGSASGGTGPTGLAVDETGVVYMAGTAGSTVFSSPATTPWPTTPGAYQTNLISPSQNAPFVTRISADGSTILSSTLMGTGSLKSMILTPQHDVLIAGVAGYNFPVTADAYSRNVSTSINGATTLGALGFFAKVSGDGTQQLYSSAFGPSGSSLYINGIGQDPSGNVWLAGTTSAALPTLVHPLQSVYSNQFSGTGFIAKFDPAMHNLLFSGYVNSATGFSQINGMAVDSNGLAHVVGIASQDFPTTQGAALRTVTPPPPNYTYNYGFAVLIDGANPGPSICFSGSSSVSAQLGTTSQRSLNIVNCGDGPLTISSLQLTSDVFALASPNACTGTLDAGNSCAVVYTFTPKAAGSASATLLINSDAPMAANRRLLAGTGTVPVVFLPGGTTIGFAPTILGSSPQTAGAIIANKGTAPLVVDTTHTMITGPFSITATSCDQGPVQVSVGNTNYTCSYSVTFNPPTAGTATGALTLYTNDPATPSVTINLSGTALASYPVPTITRLNIPTMSLDSGPVDRSVTGTNFFPATTVLVNGVSVPVKSQSNTSITFTVDPTILGGMSEFPVQVVNPAPGGSSNMVKLTTYRLLSLTATSVVYEPNSKLLYVAIPALSSDNPNTILPIDPVTGSYRTPIPVASNPTRLTLSDDGHYLYVSFYPAYGVTGQLQRIDLKTNSIDRTFTLPGSSTGIIDMHVVPGSPQLLVVSLRQNASPSENGVALFNDAGVVQYIPSDYSTNYYSLDNFSFTSDPTAYYGYPLSGSFLRSGSVSVSGIAPTASSGCCSQSSGSMIVSDGTLLYSDGGQIWDPKAKTLLGQYQNSSSYSAGIVADATAKRTFLLNGSYQPDNGFAYPAVLSYDPSTLKLADVIYFNLPPSPLNLVRWGSDGFAFLASPSNTNGNSPYSESQLVIFRSSMATPGAASGATVTSLSPTSVPAGSAALTLTVNGSGFGAGSTVLWNGVARSTTFVSASQLTAVIPAADLAALGTAQVSVSNSGMVSASLPLVIGGPLVSLSTKTLNFAIQAVATTSAAQVVTVQNSGTTSLTGLAIGVIGSDAASFIASSTCGGQLPAGSSCTVSIVFNAASAGGKQATIQITNNATDSPQTVTLNGTAAVPSFTLSSPSLSFGSVPAGSTAQQTVTLQNNGSLPLLNIAVAVSGQNAIDFTSITTCGASVAVNATCGVTVTFKPTSTGNENATVALSSTGAPSQTVSITGTAASPDFVLPPPTGSGTASVSAGQPANVSLNISPAGAFTGTVTMSCSNLPMYAACSFMPASFALGAASTPVSLTITTQQTLRASLQPRHEFLDWPSGRNALVALLLLPATSRRARRRLRKAQPVLWLLVMFTGAMLLNGCAGTGSSSGTPVETIQKTPAGAYTVTVVATSGAVSHSTNVTLLVQ